MGGGRPLIVWRRKKKTSGVAFLTDKSPKNIHEKLTWCELLTSMLHQSMNSETRFQPIRKINLGQKIRWKIGQKKEIFFMQMSWTIFNWFFHNEEIKSNETMKWCLVLVSLARRRWVGQFLKKACLHPFSFFFMQMSVRISLQTGAVEREEARVILVTFSL